MEKTTSGIAQRMRQSKNSFDAGVFKIRWTRFTAPHSMRTFAQSIMRRCGLNDTWVKVITGHTVGSDKNYLDWDEIGAEWFEKCVEKMTWLVENIEVRVRDPEQEREIREMKQKIAAMERELRGAKEELLSLPPAQLEAFKEFVRYMEARKKPQLEQLLEGEDNSSKASELE